MYIFISHSSKNASVALKICELLEENDNKCFLAPRDIRSGHEYAEEIVEGIDRSDGMIVLLSRSANKSPHVLREIERAVSRSLPIIIYKLEDVKLTKSMEYFLMTHQWMSAEAGADYMDIVECVKQLKQPPEVPKARTESAETSDKGTGKSGKTKVYAAAAIAAAVLLCFAIFLLKKPVSEGTMASKADLGKDADITETVTVNDKNKENRVKLGDTIQLGSYNGQPVEWRVLKISEDGKEGVLISKNILTMKAFDAAESGKYNYENGVDYWAQTSEADTDLALQARVRGNSDWSRSNIRTWLNSDKEVVEYEDQKPISSAMSELKNGYDNEAGFLHGFTAEELEAILEVPIETKGNALADGGTVTTRDRVYLLSVDELSWFDEAGISKLAAPTDAAVEQDKTGWYGTYSLDFGIQEYYWWLREPVKESSSKCYVVGNGYTEELIYDWAAGVESFGIRPAITVDLESDCMIPVK